MVNGETTKNLLIFGESYIDYFILKKEVTNGNIIDYNQKQKKEVNTDTGIDDVQLAYRSYPHINMFTRVGGINFIEELLNNSDLNEKCGISPDTYNNGILINNFFVIKEFPQISKEQEEICKKICNESPHSILRTEESIGVNESDLINTLKKRNETTEILGNNEYQYIIIHDTGNGFFDSLRKLKFGIPICKNDTCPEKIKKSCQSRSPSYQCKFKFKKINPELIFFSTNPLHGFAQKVIRRYSSYLNSKSESKLILFVSIDELRKAGGEISKGLSWEKTCQDTIWQIKANPKINYLLLCDILIIRIEFEGALIIYPQKNGKIITHLIFSPNLLEGGYISKKPGSIKISGIFLTLFFYQYMQKKLGQKKTAGEDIPPDNHTLSESDIIEIVKKSIEGIQRLMDDGYTRDDEKDEMKIPDIVHILTRTAGTSLHHIKIDEDILSPKRKLSWSLVQEVSGIDKTYARIAYKLLEYGPKKYYSGMKKALPFPVYQVGDLVSIDKCEIESYQTIRNIIIEYLTSKKMNKPLSFAVFGPPGSGKSFGLKQIIKELPNAAVEDFDNLTCNLSQHTTYSELTNIFHRIRDVGLTGKVPVAFFDEFDSDYEGTPLGWLKFFLAPMQDGKFFSQEHFHPFGKVIFIFAGGKNESYNKFIESAAYHEQKGPDFASRLRGHINIIGYNSTLSDQNNDSSNFDYICLMRRGLLLRKILLDKAPHLFDDNEKLIIGRDVRRALIKVSEYKFGARSIEAIIEMSSLAGRKSFEASCLPPRSMLMQHTDADDFINLLRRNYHLNEKSIMIFFKKLSLENEMIEILKEKLKSRKKDQKILKEIKDKTKDEIIWNIYSEEEKKEKISYLKDLNNQFDLDIIFNDIPITQHDIVSFKDHIDILLDSCGYSVEQMEKLIDKLTTYKKEGTISDAIFQNSISKNIESIIYENGWGFKAQTISDDNSFDDDTILSINRDETDELPDIDSCLKRIFEKRIDTLKAVLEEVGFKFYPLTIN